MRCCIVRVKRKEVGPACVSIQNVAGCLYTWAGTQECDEHTQTCAITPFNLPQTSENPCSPPINAATPILHNGRCVAVVTRTFHLLIPHWYAYSIRRTRPPTPPSQSITLSSHLFPLIGLFHPCPPSEYWPSYATDCRMTMRWESPVLLSVHYNDRRWSQLIPVACLSAAAAAWSRRFLKVVENRGSGRETRLMKPSLCLKNRKNTLPLLQKILYICVKKRNWSVQQRTRSIPFVLKHVKKVFW